MFKIDYRDFFPYSHYRKNQENIIQQIQKAGGSKKNILISAPNGTGKTIIALSALLPVAIKKDLKIIYMCRTHSQNTRVIKELHKISQHVEKSSPPSDNLKVNGLSIRGRSEMCLNETLLSLKANPKESMSVCKDLRKNKNCRPFLNLLKKKRDLDKPTLISPELFERPVDADDLIAFCREKKLCPYFLSKFLLAEMRVIICNYQWIFNPFIRKSFLKFIGKELPNCILVIDECHNVIDVSTEVNSQRISPYSLKLCLKDLEIYGSPPEMQSFVKLLLNHLEKRKQSLTFGEKRLNASKFLKNLIQKLGFSDLTKFGNFLDEILDLSRLIHEEKLANGQVSRDYIGSLANFWLKWIKTHTLDKYYFCYNVRNIKDKKSISLEIVALDPREIVIPLLKNCYTSLNMSGTVNPYVFTNLMGLNTSGKSYKGIVAKSPFKKKNIKAIITEGVNTRRENRRPLMFKKLLSKINEIVYCTPANVGIFCASYKILNALLKHGIETVAEKNNKQLFVEKPGTSASENAFLVEDFKSMSGNGGAILLGVCGGRNSEGEDYPGGYMNSVVIAGFPYHLPTPRVQAKIEYYDKVFKNQGWNFAYLYPAIQRANQASGRPIRKVEDKGAIIFLDSRFKQKYKWISGWVKNQIEIVPDKKNALTQHLYPFWNHK
ncbi:MAG: helicase C-terminal domain-containing protein [Promethearchaeia archaeon]